MSFLKRSVFIALAILTISGIALMADQSLALAATPEAKSGDIDWGYEGEKGPAYWGKLVEEYATCSTGTQQSPIDLKAAAETDSGELSFDYRATPLTIVNNGHTIQVNYAPGSTLTLDGQTYELLQFHFHDPSEHRVDGRPYPMEAHLVHQNPETGALAVIGIFLEIGVENATLAPIWDNMLMEVDPAAAIAATTVDVVSLLPTDTENFYRYDGSLTTPPCSETVNWIVMKEPVEVSLQQVEQFAAVIGQNARPVQAQGSRLGLD